MKIERTVVVTGGRDNFAKNEVAQVLGEIRPDRIVVGDATGIDAIARDWALECGIPVTVHKANWDKHGRAAGPLRNKAMLASVHVNSLVVAFTGGLGTDNCVRQAKDRGMIVLRVESK